MKSTTRAGSLYTASAASPWAPQPVAPSSPSPAHIPRSAAAARPPRPPQPPRPPPPPPPEPDTSSHNPAARSARPRGRASRQPRSRQDPSAPSIFHHYPDEAPKSVMDPGTSPPPDDHEMVPCARPGCGYEMSKFYAAAAVGVGVGEGGAGRPRRHCPAHECIFASCFLPRLDGEAAGGRCAAHTCARCRTAVLTDEDSELRGGSCSGCACAWPDGCENGKDAGSYGYCKGHYREAMRAASGW